MNIAARIESLGQAGTVFFSRNVYEKVRNLSDFKIVALGEFAFKNIEEPMEIFALANEGFPVPDRNSLSGKLKVAKKQQGTPWLVPSLIGLLLMLGFFAWNQWVADDSVMVGDTLKVSPTITESSAETDHSIAVLPFKDLSPEGNQAYFSDGISEELLNVLTKINNLKVASRTSSFAFKQADRSIPDIAQLLKVKYILEGSVRKAADQLRITAQLIDARTDRHIWSETYDRKLVDIFAIQEEVAGDIVAQVNRLVGNKEEENQPSLDFSTSNVTAYDLFLQAKNLPGEEGPNKVEKWIALLEQAVQIDSNFVDGYARLAAAYLARSSWGSNPEKMRRFIELSTLANSRAMGLDANHGLARLNQSNLLLKAYKWEDAIAVLNSFEQNSIDEKEIMFGDFATLYLELGYFDKAISIFKQDIERNPDNPFSHTFLGLSYNANGQYEQAMNHFVRARELGYPNLINLDIASIYKQRNQPYNMRYMIADRFSNDSIAPLSSYLSNVILAEGNEKQEAIKIFWVVAKERGLESAVKRNWNSFVLGEYSGIGRPKDCSDVELAWLWGPRLQEYRQSNHFKQYIKEANVLAYWQKHGFSSAM